MSKQVFIMNLSISLLIVLNFFVILDHCFGEKQQTFKPVAGRRCYKPVQVQIKQCANGYYNMTGFPNLADDESPEEALRSFDPIAPLILYSQRQNRQCAKHMHFLICSIYSPMCDENNKYLIGPCKKVCEEAKKECMASLNNLNVSWPEVLNCDRFPEEGEDKPLCMPGFPPHELNREILLQKIPIEHLDNQTKSRYSLWINFSSPNAPSQMTPEIEQTLKMVNYSLNNCGVFRYPLSYIFVNSTNSCNPLCKTNLLYSLRVKNFASLWALSLASISFLSCFTGLLTCLRNKSRFRPIEMCVVFMLFCQMFCAFSFIFAFGFGGSDYITCGKDHESGEEIRLRDGLTNSSCALVFLMKYFFNLAFIMWTLVLAFNWSLHVNRTVFVLNGRCCFDWQLISLETLENRNEEAKTRAFMGQKSISGNYNISQTFYSRGQVERQTKLMEDFYAERLMSKQHVLAWLFPGLSTVFVLVSRSVDADELLPICDVGRQDTHNLLMFSLGPRLIVLGLSTLIFLIGLIFHIRKSIRINGREGRLKQSRQCLPHIDSLGLYMGLCGLLVLIPSILSLICDSYEFLSRDKWILATNSVKSSFDFKRIVDNMNPSEVDKDASSPIQEIFILKIFLQNMIGISLSFWLIGKHSKPLTLIMKLTCNFCGFYIPRTPSVDSKQRYLVPSDLFISTTNPRTDLQAPSQATLVSAYALYHTRTNSNLMGSCSKLRDDCNISLVGSNVSTSGPYYSDANLTLKDNSTHILLDSNKTPVML